MRMLVGAGVAVSAWQSAPASSGPRHSVMSGRNAGWSISGIQCVGRYEGLFHNRHLVDGIGGTAVKVTDEEDIADVDADATLQGRIETEVARKAFDVAVEGQTHEFAAGIEHGASRVSAGDVVVRQEAGGEFTVLLGIATVVLFEIELAQGLVDDVVRIFGVFLLHQLRFDILQTDLSKGNQWSLNTL